MWRDDEYEYAYYDLVLDRLLNDSLPVDSDANEDLICAIKRKLTVSPQFAKKLKSLSDKIELPGPGQ